jgi:hypothetical protein
MSPFRCAEEKILSKFAPITAALLVRKGEAAPSLAPKRVLDWTRGLRAVVSQRNQVAWPSVSEPQTLREHAWSEEDVSPADNRKSRRVVLSFSAGEYVRLGIVAAKKDMTRHELVQAAIRNYFNQMSREFGGACSCLSGEKNADSCGSYCSETST